MTKKQQVMTNAEKFVRDAVAKDFKQSVDKVNVKTIAKRVSRVIPISSTKERALEAV